MAFNEKRAGFHKSEVEFTARGLKPTLRGLIESKYPAQPELRPPKKFRGKNRIRIAVPWHPKPFASYTAVSAVPKNL